MQKMTYEQIRPILRTGDIVLFAGTGIISTLIKWFCRLFGKDHKGKWTHIGMIITDGGRVLLFESTILDGKNGVQLNAFGKRLADYKKATVAIRWLYCEGDTERCGNKNPQFLMDVYRFVYEMLGRPYEKNLVEMMGATAEIIHVFDGHKQGLRSLFCSELICEFWRRVGFLPEWVPSNEFSPQDFELGGKVDKRFKNELGQLGVIIEIQTDERKIV